MTTTHATTTPNTWTAANNVAEEITLAELHALLGLAPYRVTIFPGKGKRSIRTFTADPSHQFDHEVKFLHKTRHGYALSKVQVLLTLPEFTPIFHFSSLGRTVRVVSAGR